MMHNVVEDDPLLPSKPMSFKLYKRRWGMLLVVVMFGISNAMIWITFAPVVNYSATYFDTTETDINWFSLVFFIAFVPCCGLEWWLIENRGFRFSVILGTLINAVGGAIRAIGVYYCTKPSDQFTVVLVGQILSACTQPLVLSMPTKIAALWFGDHERTIANTIASVANPVGVLLANAIAAALVTKPNDLKLTLAIFAIPGILAALMAIFIFHSSKPPNPPSASAMTEPVSFCCGIKEVIRNKQFLILVSASGTGIGIFSAVSSLVQQIICTKGYTSTVAGIAGAMIIVGGLVGAAATGTYIDRTRKYIRLSKILVLIMGFVSASLIITTNIRGQPELLVFSFTLYGMCALAALPVFLELGVECTYPVDEATSSGIQWMVGQVVGAVTMIGSLAAAVPLTPEEIKHSECTVGHLPSTHPVNLTYPLIVMVAFSFILLLAFIFCFTTPYKRLIKEQSIAAAADADAPTNYGDAVPVPVPDAAVDTVSDAVPDSIS